MEPLKKFIRSYPFLCLAFVYLFFRLPFLTRLPMFSDEALYIEWGWRETHISGQLFHSLYDAKQPFIMWFFGIGQSVFPDPLWGSRIISVITGFISLGGIYLVTKKIFNPKAAAISALLYIVIPFFNFFDRQAFVDSAIIASAIWSFYRLVIFCEKPNYKNAVFLGIALGLGMFTKNTAVMYLAAFLVIETITVFRNRKIAGTRIPLIVFTLITVFIINLPVYLQPTFWSTLNTNSRWTFTVSELLKFPVYEWTKNIIGNTEIAFIYFTPLVFIFIALGTWELFKSQNPNHRLILLWVFIPFVIYLFLERFMNFMIFRYITAFIPLLLLPAANYLSKHSKWLIPVLLLPAVFSLLFTVNPIAFFNVQAALTEYNYRGGYVTGYDTGYELNEIVKYIKDLSSKEPILVGIAVHSFNPESGIWDYFRNDPKVTVSYFDSLFFGPGVLDKVDCLIIDRPFYFVAKLNDTVGLSKFFDKETIITNSYNPDYVTIYVPKKNCIGTPLRLSLGRGINH